MAKKLTQWRMDIIIFVVMSIFFTILGGRLALVKQYLPGDTLARMVSAWMVVAGTEKKLASIGFVWPPIPTLLMIPFTVLPFLVKSWMAAVLVSAFSMAAAGVALRNILKLCGFSTLWQIICIVLFATNPFIFVFGANGMSEAPLIADILIAFWFLLRFWQSDSTRDMILSAGFFSLLPLLRYEIALITAGAGALLLLHSWKWRHKFDQNTFRDFLEGRLLTFGSLAIYPIFLWAVMNAQIMGAPFYFLFNERSALSVADVQLSNFAEYTQPIPGMLLGFTLFFKVFPLVFIAVFIGLLVGIIRRQPFLVGLSLLPLIIPLFQGFLIGRGSVVPLIRYYILAVPLGWIVLAAAWKAFFTETSMPARKVATAQYICLGLLVVFNLFSSYSAADLFNNTQFQSIERNSWIGIVTSDRIPEEKYRQDSSGLKVGQALPELIKPGSVILLDTYAGGYAVMLATGNLNMFMNFTNKNYDAAVAEPWRFVDYVLVPMNQDAGNLNAVNMAFPHLHDEGASWAEEVPGMPATYMQWRLYKVIKKTP